MAYGLRVHLWGPYACFSRPEFKVERVSYDCITPSAAKGIMDSIYWKPAIKWKIDKIHVIKPILFTNIRRNEVSETISLNKVRQLMKNPAPYSIVSTEKRQQRAALILRDVEYVIEAHFCLTKEARKEDTAEKHHAIASRRFRGGKFYSAPFLGTREFGCDFEMIEEGEEIPKSCMTGKLDLGYMPYGINYKIDNVHTTDEKQEVSPSFFRAVLCDGVLDLTSVSNKFM